MNASAGTGGAIWNQADSYDIYDNICKTSMGFVTWCPTYSTSPSNNHFTGTGVSYDSNGNVTNDGTTAYTWNEFSKMKNSNGGNTQVYDAFGRTVEIQGASNVEIWYTQIGKTAFMAGTTFSYGYAPSPGGGTLFYDGSNNYYLHKDWLGNTRIVSNVPGTGNGLWRTDRAYAPYGEAYDLFGTTDRDRIMFGGGSTQDVLAGVYDTPNRELQGSQQGRWLSPDPAGMGWNQYAYAANPNSQIDPSGLGGMCDEASKDIGGSHTNCNGYDGFGPLFDSPSPMFGINGESTGTVGADGGIGNPGDPANFGNPGVFGNPGDAGVSGNPAIPTVVTVVDVTADPIITVVTVVNVTAPAPADVQMVPVQEGGPPLIKLRIATTNYIFNGTEGKECRYDLFCPNGNTAATCKLSPVYYLPGAGGVSECMNYLQSYDLVVNGVCIEAGPATMTPNNPINCN